MEKVEIRGEHMKILLKYLVPAIQKQPKSDFIEPKKVAK
jgi:hypothetical protein